ncbi:hypothetical protein Tco_1017195 [Tanacetum coccineum]|uniref:Uncharacterized protein n=1 Tax=Tanacetum coccineum TaxID=301880 RepID=A0ABQ5FS15_9ASTR
MEKRRKHFAALRAQEKRNRPPTKAQKRTQMSTYLKHMGGYTYKQLKGKSFDETLKVVFCKEMKRRKYLCKLGVSEEESSKKQKVEEEKEPEEVEEDDEVELKKLLVIKKDEDIEIDAIPLATKLPVIIDYKLHKEGMLVHYELIRADGSSKRYSSMIRMLQGIDREDLEALWRILKEKDGDTRPKDEFERVLYGDLRVMFESDIKSDVWRMLQGYRVTNWKLIDSSGVHFVRFDNLHIFMLVERRYTLTPITITNMLNKKLQTDHQNEICYQLLKLMVKNRSRIGINKLLEDLKIISEELAEFINSPSWNRPTFYDVDDDEYTIIYRSSKAITPDLSIEEPDKSLSMGDEHLSTIPETKSNEVIKSSVENLVPIPSESEGISDDTDDTTHNLSPEVFFDHEPQHDTFSPKSDPLHHEFTGELITIPPRIVREHEDYINRMSLLCGNSSSQSPENSHTIIESLPTSTTLIEDNDSNREEIDIFSGPDDSIPPGIESDFDSEEDIIDNLLNDDLISEYERLTFDMEPDVPVINNGDELNEDECFDPGGGEINVEVDDSFTFEMRIFIPYLTYPEVSPLLSSTENEDTIFDPSIFAFHFSSQEPVVVKCFMEFCSSTCFIPKDE